MKLPSLSALRAFEAAARHLSFTRAAEELCVTQAAVSHQVRALEEELGHALFNRHPRRVSLTEEGRILSQAASSAFSEIAHGVEAMAQAGHTGAVNVSVSPSLAVKWLLPRLDDFRDSHPEIDVRISANDRLIDPVREGVDLCIRYGPGNYPGLETTLLMKDQVYPVCSPALKRELGSPADLSEVVLLQDEMMIEDDSRPDWKKWFEAAGVEDPCKGETIRFSHAVMMIDAALAGQGVALGRSTLVADDLEQGRLVRPFEPFFESAFAYWVAVPKGAVLGPKITAFREWLLAQAGTGAPTG
ncbi:MAG: transcriptional regulator GcvA [Deltaproteobacteria bacterium]